MPQPLPSNMANAKSVAELPRFLLPRLTWTSPPVKGATSQLRPSRKQYQRPAPAITQQSSKHTVHSSQSADRSHHYVALPESSPNRLRTSSQPLAIDAAPIRHNGVYAAVFKPARRAFSTTGTRQKDHHFDTLKFVQRLKNEGFNEEQGVAMMRVLNDVIEESIQNLTRTMVLKEGAFLSRWPTKW